MTASTPVLRFKILSADRRPCHGGRSKWPWPVGKWLPKRTPKLCQSGYHVCTGSALFRWIHAPVDWALPLQSIWICEVRGGHVVGYLKEAWEQERILTRLPWDEAVFRHVVAGVRREHPGARACNDWWAVSDPCYRKAAARLLVRYWVDRGLLTCPEVRA